MALVLAIDIRNTRTRIGLALDGRLVSQWAVPTDPDETADGAVASKFAEEHSAALER